DEMLVPFVVHGEGGAAATAHADMAFLDSLFDVLRVVVAAANDQQVLETTGNEEIGTMDEAKVSGSKERATTVRESCRKNSFTVLRPTPVAAGDARAGKPDLADVV